MTINSYEVNGAEALDEEAYQLWLRDPASAVAHLVEVDYHGDSAVYPNWVTYTLKSSDTAGLSFDGYPDRIRSIGNFTQQIGDRFTGIVGASIGEIVFDNTDGSLDLWHNLALDGQRVKVRHGDPSWAEERFRTVYECVAEGVSSSTWDAMSLRVRGVDYKYNLPLQTNLINTVTANGTSNLPIPKAYGKVFNIEPALVDNVNLIYQWNDGAVTSVSDVRDSGYPFQTAQIAISAVTAATDTLSTATSHGFYANTRVRCDIGTLPTDAIWSNIAWNGTVFCAVAYNSSIAATSPDGVTWTQRTLPTSTNWQAVAWNGTVFCAVAIGTSIAATSPDGVTWTQRTLPTSTNWQAVAWNGTVFCAVAESSTIAATSPDGITWTQRTLPTSTAWNDIAWNGTVFCAVAYNSSIAATSPDGVTWTQRTLPVSANWGSLAWNGTVFCAVAYNSSIAATSPDGVTWTQRTLPTSTNWQAVAWNGTVFCAVAANTSIAATSPDGITWTQRTLPTSTAWVDIEWNGTVFCTLSISIGHKVSVSPDGITWSAVLDTLPAPLAINTDYWVIPDGLTTTAFKLSDTRGGTVVNITGTDTGAPLIGFHWTADLTTGKVYLDSKSAGRLTMDGEVHLGSASSIGTLAADIVPAVLSAVNVDPSSYLAFESTCPQTVGIYVNQRRNRLEVADDVINGLGAWYGYGREGMLKFGRVEGNPTSYMHALIEDDLVFNSLHIDHLVPPEKQHRLSFRKNWTNQAGELVAAVSADNRTLYSNDYSVSSPSTGTDVGASDSFHVLAKITDVQPTMMYYAADAKTEADRLDATYYGWGAVFACTAKRVGTLIDVGDTVKLTHSRFGLSGGVNMTCVYVNRNPSADTVELKFFVALAAYTPGQL